MRKIQIFGTILALVVATILYCNPVHGQGAAAQFVVGQPVSHVANAGTFKFPAGTGKVTSVTPWNTGDGYSYQVRCDMTGKVLPVNFKASELTALTEPVKGKEHHDKDKMPVPPGYVAEKPAVTFGSGCADGSCGRATFVEAGPVLTFLANQPVRTFFAKKPLRTFIRNHRPHILFQGGGCGG
jgi:hypothetical protein